MKKCLFFLFTVLLAWSAIGQTQGVSMRATNGVGFGVTIVQGRLEATNQGVTNIIAGRIQGAGGRAQGAGAVALGLNNANVGAYSITAGIGNNNAASGAILTGRSNLVASGSTYSLMSGEFNSAQDPSELVAGTSNVVAGNYSAAIGSRIVMDSGSHRSVGLGQNIFISGGISNVFAWNSSTTSDVIPTVTDSFTVNAPGGIFLNGSITFGGSNTYAGAFIGDGSGITNIAPVSGVAALTYVVSGGGQAVVNGTYTNGNSVVWTKGAGITACELRYAPGGSPVWAFYNNATPLYSADSLGGPWTIDVGGLAPAPTVLIGSGNFGAFYGDGAYLTNIGANSIRSMWASNVFAGGTLAVSDIVSAGTFTGNGAGLTNLTGNQTASIAFVNSNNVFAGIFTNANSLFPVEPTSRQMRVALLGDSIFAGNSYALPNGYATNSSAADSWPVIAAALSGGWFQLVNNGAVSSTYLTNFITRVATQVLPFTPSHCLIAGPMNDAQNQLPIAPIASNYLYLVDYLLDNNITPICCTVMPSGSTKGPSCEAINNVIREIARQRQLQVFDAFAAFNEYGTNNVGATGLRDGVHPTRAGAISVATAFCQQFGPPKYLPTAPLALSMYSTNNLITNGLAFDWNADGKPDGWGTNFSSYFADLNATVETNANVVGNWAVITKTTTNSSCIFHSPRLATGTMTAGDRLLISFRVFATITGVAPAGYYNLTLGLSTSTNSAEANIYALAGMTNNLPRTSVVTSEYTVPGGVTNVGSLGFFVNMIGISGTIGVAQVNVRNLTREQTYAVRNWRTALPATITTNLFVGNNINATNTVSAHTVNTINPGFRSTGTNGFVFTDAVSGTYILQSSNGVLVLVTNTAGL